MLFTLGILILLNIATHVSDAKIDMRVKYKEFLVWAKQNAGHVQAQLEKQKEKDLKMDVQSGVCKISTNQIPCSQNAIPVQAETQAIKNNIDDKLLIFVSFSMPRTSLKALAESASKYHAVLVLRGLVDNSFQKTEEMLKDFKEGMEINPELFKTYQITVVPTFVLLKEGKEQNRLSGNVSLTFAYQKLKEQT